MDEGGFWYKNPQEKNIAMNEKLAAQRSGNTIQVSGSIPITFADWSIPNPSFGPVTTQDHGTLEFLVNFAKAATG